MDYWSDTRYDVSIHTRHYWRVKQRTRIPGPARRHVSIHTRHYWRVKPPGPEWAGYLLEFQSTPAITGG